MDVTPFKMAMGCWKTHVSVNLATWREAVVFVNLPFSRLPMLGKFSVRSRISPAPLKPHKVSGHGDLQLLGSHSIRSPDLYAIP